MEIRPIVREDYQQVCDIYNHYVRESIATFDMLEKELDDYSNTLDSISASFPFLVCMEEKEVLGFTYANHWNDRDAYKRTVTSTVYVHPEHLGKGLGKLLYSALFDVLKVKDYHVIIGGISLPNESSIRLHESFGFTKIAHFKEVGRKFDQWIDVGYWQLTL